VSVRANMGTVPAFNGCRKSEVGNLSKQRDCPRVRPAEPLKSFEVRSLGINPIIRPGLTIKTHKNRPLVRIIKINCNKDVPIDTIEVQYITKKGEG
jgi:hypothetical protein